MEMVMDVFEGSLVLFSRPSSLLGSLPLIDSGIINLNINFHELVVSRNKHDLVLGGVKRERSNVVKLNL
jgi:hypothetical protein